MIHELAKQGDLPKLKAALRKCKDIEAPDEHGRTPLMAAVASEQADIGVVRCLIEHGANVNAVSSRPSIDLDAQELALLREVDPASPLLDLEGEGSTFSALSLAVEHASLPIIKLLVESGAEAGWSDNSGYSMILKTLYRQVETSDAERVKILNLLIASGAPLDTVTEYGESALNVASYAANVKLVKLFLNHGANPSVLGWNGMFYAIAFGTLEDLASLIDAGAPLEDIDGWDRTPFLFAVQCGRLKMAKLLLDRGCDRHAVGRDGRTAVSFAVEGNRAETLKWLLENGWRPETDGEWPSVLRQAAACGKADCVKALLDAGADVEELDHYGFNLMHETSSLKVAKVLHEAGLALDGLPSEQRPMFLSLDASKPLSVSAREFDQYLRRRFGASNPQEMTNRFWSEMVRTRLSAHQARQGRQSCEDASVWCCNRFGQSLTMLPSGDLVEIGGEHEDYHDPDFCIYNDVIVHDGKGQFEIYGYPENVFPPTDFHSATWIDGFIYIIGNLGYPDARHADVTPVFRLNCKTWRIHAVPSRGHNPGWIHRHRAKACDDSTILIWGGQIDNGGELEDNHRTFRFDPRTGTWTPQSPQPNACTN